MTSANAAGPAMGVPPPIKTSYNKNLKWLIVGVVGGVLAFFALFVLATLLFVESIVKNTYPYQFAREKASESAEVSARLGQPLQFGRFVSGSVKYSGSNGEAFLQIPISGPKAHGTLVVVGERRDGKWNFKILEVRVRGSDEPILLLDQSGVALLVAPCIRSNIRLATGTRSDSPAVSLTSPRSHAS